MGRHGLQNRASNRSSAVVFAWIVLVVAALAARPLSAETYISAEPIPSVQIVGTANLNKIEGLGYSSMALWSQRLLNDCGIVQNVILTLSNNKAITTILPGNARFGVAAGGFQGVATYLLLCLDDKRFGACRSKRSRYLRARQRPRLRAEPGRNRSVRPHLRLDQPLYVFQRLCGRDICGISDR